MAKDKPLRYAIDLPDPNNLEGEMVNMGYFETKREALRWAKDNIGTDSKGRINVLSRMPQED